MSLEFRRFRKGMYLEYAAWFADPELNERLGPMGRDWLEAVLTERETDGETWAVFRSAELVAVVETAFNPEQRNLAVITGLAVKPQLRGQGFGKAVLAQIVQRHRVRGISRHLAQVKADNFAVQSCLKHIEFALEESESSEEGFLSYCTDAAQG